MITKNDLKQIREVVREEIGTVDRKIDNLDQKLIGKIDGLDQKLTGKIDGLDQKLTGKIEKLDQKLDNVQEDVAAILTEVIVHHDKLEKRVDRIEEHLDLPKSQ